MQEQKIKKSFELVKEDINDIYTRLDELKEAVDELRVNQRTMADKLVKKADKKTTKKTSSKKKSKKKTKKK
jgi:uncharacterized protein HemX